MVAAPAAAEEPKVESADGITGCHEFHKRNERELAEWMKQQPPTPYEYPQPDLVLEAPWNPVLKAVNASSDLLLASLLPHVGAQLRADAPGLFLAWPWSVPFGPAYTCTRKRGSFVVKNFFAHRALLEPGIVAAGRGAGLFVRPGYRFVHHPSDWVVGVGGGIGSTIELVGNREPLRASVSGEALVQFGGCCDPGYFMFTARYDRYLAGGVRDTVTASLGLVYF